MRRYNLIDANSLGHKYHQAGKLNAGQQQTQAVFGTLLKARDLIVEHPNQRTIFLWDGRSWRYDEFPDYKGNRVKTEKQKAERAAYVSQAVLLRNILSTLGVSQITASNYEADDLAGVLTGYYISRGDKVRLITTDEDWLQLVQPGVIWEDHRKLVRVRSATFASYTGFETPEQFLENKALKGDGSDKIGGVGGIGKGRSAELIKIWGSVASFLNDSTPADTYQTETGNKIPKAFLDFHSSEERHAIFKRNMRLMNLMDAKALPHPLDYNISKEEANIPAFRRLCGELAFHSILNDLDNFVEPFVNQEERLDAIAG